MSVETPLDNLWPTDFGTTDVVPPVVILRQQATMLGQLTQNILRGEVQSNHNESGTINHAFFIKAPALDDYRYYLFDIEHKVDELYPVRLDSKPRTPFHNEAEFREALREIFAAERTRKVIRSLLAQSKAGFDG